MHAVSTTTPVRPALVASLTLPRWVAPALSGLAGLALLALFVLLARAPREDFVTYYQAGQAARAGGADLYTAGLAWRDVGYTVNLPAPAPVEGSPYVYPPAFALAFAPLTLLPLGAASLVWYAVSFACVALSVWLLSALLLPISARWRLPATLGLTILAMLFGPVRTNFAAGQTDCLLLLLVTLSFWAFARQRATQAGLWLAVAVAIKPTIVVLAAYFLWKRAYRAAITFGVGAAILAIVPTFVLGIGSAIAFVAVAQHWSSAAFAVSPINQAPYGLLLRLFSANLFTVPLALAPSVPAVARLVLPLLAALVLARTIGRSTAVGVQRLGMEYGLVIVAVLVAAPVSEDNHFTYLILPLLAATGVLLSARHRLPSRARLLAGLGLAISFVYLSWPALRAIRQVNFAYYSAPLAGPVVLLTGVFLYGLLLLSAVLLVVAHWSAAAADSTSSASTGS